MANKSERNKNNGASNQLDVLAKRMNFELKKYLARMRVINKESQILERETDELDKKTRIGKIKRFIKKIT